MSYVRGTVAALVDAVVPETPDLAARGEEHVPGGLADDVDETVVEALDDLLPVDGGPLAVLGYDAAPLSVAVAVLLDLAAVELLVRRRAEAGLQRPDDALAAGPFSRLSRRDRLRAVDLLGGDGLLARSGTVRYLVQATVTVTQMAHYGDWDGDEHSSGWRQADYPGPSDGYAALLGYEVEAFEEDDY